MNPGAPQAARAPSARTRFGWLVAFALALFACFPQSAYGRVVDLGFVAAWVAPALFVVGLRGLGVRSAARAGALFVWFAHGVGLYWAYVAVVDYGHAPAPLGVLAPFAMSLYAALFGAGLGALVASVETARVRRARLPAPLVVAAGWVVFEHLRSFVGGGFPWITLGYAHHTNDWLLGLAPWTGVYGLSFVSVLGSVSLLHAFEALRSAGPLRARLLSGATGDSRWALGLGVALLLVGLGGWNSSALEDEREEREAEVVRIAAIQGNIDQGQKWDAARMDATLDIYSDLTRQAAAAGARIVAWPETAFPGLFELDALRRERVLALAREQGVVLVVGAVGIDPDESGQRIGAFYDSAFAVGADGRVFERYDKTRLVPFGEYIPLRGLIGRFITAIATGATSSDVTPGPRVRAFDVELPARVAEAADSLDFEPAFTLRVGVPICYELLFPDLMRRFARDGAQVLIGITNDAWYGRTGAPHQFLAMTAMRAAESRVPLVRAANTGVSASIGADGRVAVAQPAAGSGNTQGAGERHGLLQSSIFERSFVVADVPLRGAGAPPPFYVRFGDVFAWACWALIAVHAGIHLRESGRAAEETA